jgi:hypothetical protein
MSSRALAARKSGQIQPSLENGAIRALRQNPSLDRRAALEWLASPLDAEWREAVRCPPENRTPQLIRKAVANSYDVYTYRGDWYAVPTGGEAFDPERASSGAFRRCLRAGSQAEIEQLIRLAKRVDWVPEIVRGGYRRARAIAGRCFEAFGGPSDRPVIQNTPLARFQSERSGHVTRIAGKHPARPAIVAGQTTSNATEKCYQH